ncbi:VOC family protein [Mycobacterium sp. 852002-51163_SCH5372311]|uniref:VOC family protein n=1 Tax=Mycobacterium sp. 852002-51163_SCH5372311 TaxID=1834097 RepID=UPI002101B64B|nr:VOC family protein [Mycobacterium sp. 852002-51163_SCH5372311]
MEAVGRPPLAGLHHLGISVTSLDRSLRFYCDVVGADLLVPPNNGTSPSFVGRVAILSLGGRIVDLCEHSRNEGERFDPARTGLDHLALAAESVDELHAWATWLDNCGVSRSPVREVADGLGTMFDFVDPDGIQIEVIHLSFS